MKYPVVNAVSMHLCDSFSNSCVSLTEEGKSDLPKL